MNCNTIRQSPRCEFHVSRRARERYGFDLGLFGSTGNVIFADFRAARLFADRMNQARDLAAHPEQAVQASQINAMGLIDEMLHLILARYRERVRPRVIAETLAELEGDLGVEVVSEVLATFVDEFPPVAVYRGEISADDYLARTTRGTTNREIALEELLLLCLANTNPAFAPFRELFDDSRLRRETAYSSCVEKIEAAFAGRPGLDAGGQTLLDLLVAPMRAAPTSLEGQLAYIRAVWVEYLGDVILRVLSSLDFLAEESKPFFGFGPGPVEPPDSAISATSRRLLGRPGLDAAAGAAGQERLRLAGPAVRSVTDARSRRSIRFPTTSSTGSPAGGSPGSG